MLVGLFVNRITQKFIDEFWKKIYEGQALTQQLIRFRDDLDMEIYFHFIYHCKGALHTYAVKLITMGNPAVTGWESYQMLNPDMRQLIT